MNKIKKRFLLMPLILMLSACGKTDMVVKSSSETEDVSAQDDVTSGDGSDEAAGQQDVSDDEKGEPDPDLAELEKAETETVITVYVCGAVRKEGVYRLLPGSIVDDALRAAGGYSDEAYHGYINLAGPVSDGMRIYFPSRTEMEGAIITEAGISQDIAEPDGTDSNERGSGNTSENGQKNRVNINTADKAELMTLPGIGESRAEEIIKYRNAHGDFKSIDDIKNISGIKNGIFEKIRDLITV
ncbi:MAG: helix-hairpin-helix domain-containing protein [Eubacterium sp.]|nr:helix-hairpin-helix domain-containing protein [Eubacterium sp.]